MFPWIVPFHSGTLSTQKLRLRHKLDEMKRKCADESCRKEFEKLETVFENFEVMQEIVETNTTLKPYCVLGVPASSSVTMSLCTTIASFYVTFIGLLSNSEEQFFSTLSR